MDNKPEHKVIPTPPSLMDLSIAIAPWAHIKNIRLLKSSVELKSLEVTESAEINHIFDATTTFNPASGELVVHASVTVSAENILRIDGEFLLNYRVDMSGPVTAEIATAFGRMNGVHNLWPYWREFVYSISARTGLPPIVLPLMTGASMLNYYTEKDKSSISSQVVQTQEENGPHIGDDADA
ncbi:MAG: hypothetical protein JW959_15235 [Pirellulales bacterium]|nr:hypothetical protein [Pirellulales bacterium]